MTDDDVIPIGVPELPGKPEAQRIIVEAMNQIVEACDDAEATASILFTVGLAMATSLGISRAWILRAVEKKLGPARVPRALPPGKRRRVRCH